MGFVTGLSVSFFGLSVVLLTPITHPAQLSWRSHYFSTLSVIFLVLTAAAALFMKNPDKEYYYSEITKVIPPDNIKQFKPSQMLKSPSYYYILFSAFTSSAGYLLLVPFITTLAAARGMSETMGLFSVMSTGVAMPWDELAPLVSDRLSAPGRPLSVLL